MATTTKTVKNGNQTAVMNMVMEMAMAMEMATATAMITPCNNITYGLTPNSKHHNGDRESIDGIRVMALWQQLLVPSEWWQRCFYKETELIATAFLCSGAASALASVVVSVRQQQCRSGWQQQGGKIWRKRLSTGCLLRENGMRIGCLCIARQQQQCSRVNRFLK